MCTAIVAIFEGSVPGYVLITICLSHRRLLVAGRALEN